MIKLLTIVFFVMVLTGTGDTLPQTGENNADIGATAWTGPSNCTAEDALDATCNAGASSQYLVARNFLFSLPAAAVVQGVTVNIQASEHSPATETLNAQLQNESGTLFGDSKTASIGGTAKTVYTYGANTDIWGAVITDVIVEDADFGVRFWFTTQHDVRIDYVTMNVEYTIYNKKGNFFQFFTQTKKSNQITNL